MAGGFRITESGDSRILENGDSRITEEQFFGSTALSGAGTASFTMTAIQYASVGPLASDSLRVTEAGDTRILENGTDNRITGDVTIWTGYGVLSAVPTVAYFSGTPYIKHDGTWKVFVPWVKHEGSWVQPTKIYVKQSGVWTRTY